MTRTEVDPPYAVAYFTTAENVAYWRSMDNAYWFWHLMLYMRLWLQSETLFPKDAAIVHSANCAIELLAMEAVNE